MAGIDYRALRCRLRLGQVLDLLGFVPSTQCGPQVRGPCPLHGSRVRRAAVPSPHTWNATAGSASAAAPAATPWTCGWPPPGCRCMRRPWICVADSTWRYRGCPPAVRPEPENTPDRAVELLAEPEARQGRTRWRKPRRVSNYWDFEPVMLPCVLVPDLAGLDWPAARLPEFIANRPSMSDDFLKAALPPSCSRTGRCVEQGVYPALRWSRFHPTTTPPLNARCRSDRFDWPAGGTEEFLGRWSARINSRHTEAKGVRADPLYVFGAVGRTEPLVWFFLTVTVTAMTEPRGVATRGERSLLEAQPFKTAVRQVGNSGVRALTLVSIYGFGSRVASLGLADTARLRKRRYRRVTWPVPTTPAPSITSN